MVEQFKEGVHYTKDERGCWIWIKSINYYGYGQLHKKGITYKVHRLSYQFYRGEIPKGLSVLHTCDVRRCINPDHLFLGTQEDNMKDMAKKGRGTRIPEQDEEFVIYFKGTGKSLREIGRLVGISHNTVKRVLDRRDSGRTI